MKFNISLEWWNAVDNTEPKEDHLDYLTHEAVSLIGEKLEDGFVAGELFASRGLLDYRGYWEVKVSAA